MPAHHQTPAGGGRRSVALCLAHRRSPGPWFAGFPQGWFSRSIPRRSGSPAISTVREAASYQSAQDSNGFRCPMPNEMEERGLRQWTTQPLRPPSPPSFLQGLSLGHLPCGRLPAKPAVHRSSCMWHGQGTVVLWDEVSNRNARPLTSPGPEATGISVIRRTNSSPGEGSRQSPVTLVRRLPSTSQE